MSLPPSMMEIDRPKKMSDQQYALALTEELVSLITPQLARDVLRPWKPPGPAIKVDKNKFQVNLDVQHFAPEEISVKTYDGFVVVEGKHEEKHDEHGYVSRQFMRRYVLPENCNIDAVESRLSSDGVLMVTAPLSTVATNEKVVPIVQTGPLWTQTGAKGEPGAKVEPNEAVALADTCQ